MRIGGLLQVSVNGETVLAKGSWTVNPGTPKKEMIVGSDQVHGYKEMPTVPFAEGVITGAPDTDIEALQQVADATITINLASGQVFVLEQAVYSGDGNITTEENEIATRFEGMRGRFVTP